MICKELPHFLMYNPMGGQDLTADMFFANVNTTAGKSNLEFSKKMDVNLPVWHFNGILLIFRIMAV